MMRPVYMNNAATSWPKAPGVARRVQESLEALPQHAWRTGFNREEAREGCRTLLKDLMRIGDARDIAYASNATHALNIAIQGFDWKPGARAVTTDAEHNSVLRPLHYLQKRGVLEYACVPVDGSGRVVMEAWERALDKKTAMAVFSHASNVTGAVNDAAALSAMARAAGAVVLVDASQTLGIIDVFPEEWDADMVAFTGHKYLLGPPGTGGLYVRPGTGLEPVFVGGTGIRSDMDEMPSEMPLHLEAGTPNDPSFAGLAEALAWRRENPPDAAGVSARVRRVEEGLKALGARVITVDGPRTPVVSFTLPGWDVEDAGAALQQSYGIVCRTGLHCAPRIHAALNAAPRGTVRVSLSRFTTDEEVGYLLSAVKEML